MLQNLLITLVVATTCCWCFTFDQPEVSIIQSGGIRFAYPDDGSLVLVGYHYNINTPLVGVAAGEYNFDVNNPTNGYFVSENPTVQVNIGDTVYYWINVISSEGGFTLTDQSYMFQDPTQPPITSPPTTLPPTTTPDQATQNPTNQPTTTKTDPPPTVTVTDSPTGGNGGGETVIGVSCSSYPCDPACDASVPPCNGLIFEENWDDLDLDRWQHEITMSGGGNWEFQVYTNNRSNSYVRDNTLFIKPTLTSDHYGESFLSSGTIDLWGGSPADVCTSNSFWGCQRTGSGSNYLNPVKSARIRTVNSFAFKYGRLEIEAKLPNGDWLWPAIWLLPKVNRFGQWPASGEIDIMESRGNANLKDEGGVSHGNDAIGSTLHWGPFWPLNGYEQTTGEVHSDFASKFHTYAMDWNENGISLSVDGVPTLNVDPGSDGFWKFGDFANKAPGIDNPWKEATSKMTPFDQEFFLIINLAVGGTNGYFPDGWTNGNGKKPWANTSPTAFKDFWDGKSNWYPTWNADTNNGEDAALQVKSVKVWAN